MWEFKFPGTAKLMIPILVPAEKWELDYKASIPGGYGSTKSLEFLVQLAGNSTQESPVSYILDSFIST